LHVSRVGDGTYAANLSESRTKAGFIVNPESTSSSVQLNISKTVNGGGIIYQPTNSAGTTPYNNIFNPFGGNVGIGTTTPIRKLVVSNGGAEGFEVNPQAGIVSFNTYSRSGSVYVDWEQAGLNQIFKTGTAAAERMRIDSSGNLGLGVVPSAWATSFKAMQLGAGGSISGRTNTDEIYVGANCFFDTTDNRWEYIATDVATQYFQDAGTHVWRTAPSGTAGNAITFTQAMTLDASGRLLVGTTTAVTQSAVTPRMQLSGVDNNTSSFSASQYNNSTASPILFLNKSRGASAGSYTAVSSGDFLGRLFFTGADGTAFIQAASIAAQVDGTPGTNDMPGRLVFSTTADGASTPTERLRITSAGNVGIGTSSPACALDVVGGIQTSRTAVTAPAAGDGNVFSGTYTPTLTNSAGISASTASSCQYIRVGNTVTVSGVLEVTTTGTGSQTVGITLPIASNLSSISHCSGAGCFYSATFRGVSSAIYADVTNDRATLNFLSPSAASGQATTFTFTYRVI
jgi:hypothetical protein